jgi:enamine deaminase RidA (YjgF/YER057c/UK114 family)
MAHTRLRKFETNTWYRGTQKLNNEFCMVVEAGDFLFLRGQTGHDFNGDFHGHGDAGAQAEQAMANVKVLLEEAGSSFADICKIEVFVTDRGWLDPVRQVVGKHLKGVHVVMNEVIVKGLARPYMNMEIDVYAVRGGA